MELEQKILEMQQMKDLAELKVTEFEQEEVETIKRIKTTTQVHQNCIINKY